MNRRALALGILASCLPLGGCVGICTDSRGEAFGRNWNPFGRRYFMCNGGHCTDGAGMHIDQRCSCSQSCSCWGGSRRAQAEDAAPGSEGCGCGTTEQPRKS